MAIQGHPDLSTHDLSRAQRLLMLEFGSRDQFDDPKLEYRRLFSEVLGVSGAHPNPVVSRAFAVRGDFRWRRVPGYIIMQLVGAMLACLFLLAVFGNVEHLGATLPGPGYQNWQAFLMEIALTGALLGVILGTASAAQNVGAIGALGVGGYIALAGLWSAPVSGTSMNRARSFGPALVSGDRTACWVYVAGPLIGAAIAVGCAIILRGPGGDPISHAVGSGVLTPAASRRRPSSRGRSTMARPRRPTLMSPTHSRSRDPGRLLMRLMIEETLGRLRDEVPGSVAAHGRSGARCDQRLARADGLWPHPTPLEGGVLPC